MNLLNRLHASQSLNSGINTHQVKFYAEILIDLDFLKPDLKHNFGLILIIFTTFKDFAN